MKIVLAGAGAFGQKHLDAIRTIGGVEVVSLVGRELEPTRAVASKYGIGHVTRDLGEALAQPGVTAAILCTPTQIHAQQSLQCLEAGKHVQVEIPLADSWADAQRVNETQKRTGLVCMVGHTRRFNPSHQWVHKRITSGELRIQQMDVQTYFFRRTNMNALGQPRSWTDHLLWHHAAHTVDLFRYQTGERRGRRERRAGAAFTRRSASQWTCRSSSRAQPARSARSRCRSTTKGRSVRSFATSATTARTLRATTILYNGKDEKIDVSNVDVSMNGIELQDREFFAAIRAGREPNASVASVLDCYRTLHELEQKL